MRLSLLLATASTSILAACANGIVAPHFVRTQPEVDGVLLTAGVPRVGVQIAACQGLRQLGPEIAPRHCDKFALATTDAEGRFHFESHGYVDTDLLPYGDRATFEILGIESGGREIVWHQVWRRPSPERLVLACELNARLVCEPAQVP